jgi:hypothetical protein
MLIQKKKINSNVSNMEIFERERESTTEKSKYEYLSVSFCWLKESVL